MDLHIYRNSEDRWYDLNAAARQRGAVLAMNAVTLHELIAKLTPESNTLSVGQRFVLTERAVHNIEGTSLPGIIRYFYEAIGDLKAASVSSSELRTAGGQRLAQIFDEYDDLCRAAGLLDPQDRAWFAATRVMECDPARGHSWLAGFQRVVLHALYDVSEVEFTLIRNLIQVLPEGGTVMMFNTTANVKPTEFAEWTWQRFVQDETLALRAFPEFCARANPGRTLMERLFVFESKGSGVAPAPLAPDPSVRIFAASGRYKEVEWIGWEIADLLASGRNPSEIAVVVRNIEKYGEMIEDIFSRYNIPHTFETGVPLVRIPFVKYWLSLLDLVTSERSRRDLSRVMGSAYYEPRLSPGIDVEKELNGFGYIDRNHLAASAMAARKGSPLTAELAKFEQWLDGLEAATEKVSVFLEKTKPPRRLDSPLLSQEWGHGAPGWLERDWKAWQSLTEELELAGAVIGEVSFAQFRRIASEIAGLRTTDRLSSVNAVAFPGLPRIRVMPPDALGYRSYRWIFAPGLAEGEFPSRRPFNPLLTEPIVDALNRRIYPRRLIGPRARQRREPLYLFMILDSASEVVTLTFPDSTLEGETIYPSTYIGEIARHYAVSPVNRLQQDFPARESGEFLRKIADQWRSGALREDEARHLLGEDVVRRVALEKRGSMRGDVGPASLPIDCAWHPSELNSLAMCPFVFLSKYRLKLKASDTPEFEVPPFEVGILAHNILREFYTLAVPRSVEEARKRIHRIINERFANVDINGQGPYSVFDPALWQIRRRQLVLALLQYVEFAVRDAVDGYETQPEYLDKPLPQARLGPVMLAGKPDHIAVHRRAGRIDGIRIDDFKYSAASRSTTQQLKQSLQVPLYAYLATRAFGIESGIHIEGRYLLLRSPSNPVVSHAIDESVFDDLRLRIEGLIEKVHQGQLHADPADKQECANCDYKRLCRINSC